MMSQKLPSDDDREDVQPALEHEDIDLREDRHYGGPEPTVNSGKFKIVGIACGVFLILFLVLAIVAAAGGVPWPEVTYVNNRTVQLPMDAIFVALTAGFYATAVVAYLTHEVLSAPIGMDQREGETMRDIANDIRQGARAFLKREYTTLLYFVIIVAVLLVFTDLFGGAWRTSVCFLCGAGTSALCGWIGMDLATQANVRTTNQARTSLPNALKLAFNAGTVMGLSVVGLGIMVLAFMFLIFHNVEYIAGFGFGASSIALFARVGGGIFTKAADVGADLVGKVEQDIPEDDPRNPAVIADNVGDNVGDVAGMGADLFESYVGSIIAAVALGKELGEPDFAARAIAAPFYLAAAGIICSVIGAACVKTKETEATEGIMDKLLWAIRRGILIAAGLNVVAGFLILMLLDLGLWVFLAYISGLIAGIGIGFATEYYTSFVYQPTKDIAKAGTTGPATVIIKGLAVGMISNIPPVVILFFTILLTYLFGNQNEQFGTGGGEYCVAIAAVGMLSTLGVTLATDAYGPVADNAGGIAEMAGLPESVRDTTDALDALGNTTAATGKGFAIGSAVLTALALLRAFANATTDGTEVIDVLDAQVLCGLMVGVLLPYIFASLTMTAVGDSAQEIIVEVRRQFRDIPGLKEGNAKADSAQCVDIATRSAVKKMIAPGALAVIVPVIFCLGGGPKLGIGLLAGAILSGFMLAVTMANAGGAWDNAKKYVEAGNQKNDAGEVVAKGTELHKAVVVGDTVGDPFKDTSGPALNILIKLMSVISLVMAPLVRTLHSDA